MRDRAHSSFQNFSNRRGVLRRGGDSACYTQICSRKFSRRIWKKNIKKSTFLRFWRVRIFSWKVSKNWIFLTKKSFQVLLENFLEQIWAWPRYEKCYPNVALSNGEKIRVVRHIDRKIFKEIKKSGPKKILPRAPL